MESHIKIKKSSYTATRNACKLCSPLGASMAFKGLKNCITLIHGSQGCATYIRRYLISHFREPFDIASSSFSEETAIFGGAKNFNDAIKNIISQYNPEVIGIATTCLSETIGEDVKRLIRDYRSENKDVKLPDFIHTSTPSYQGTHSEGYHETVKSIIETLANKTCSNDAVNIFPGFVSPADMRHLKQIFNRFGIKYIMVPDYSESADNPYWEEYKKLPEGGTSVDLIREAANAKASIEFGHVFNRGTQTGSIKNHTKYNYTAGEYLSERFSVVCFQCGLPIGVNETDKFFDILQKLSSREIPEIYKKERGRLIDSYVDGHKIMFGKRAIVYGEEDLVIALTKFLSETGIKVVLAISGGNSGKLSSSLNEMIDSKEPVCTVSEDADFEDLSEIAGNIGADIMIGNSKGYYIASSLKIPLVRVGFPVHDRFGAQRISHLAYSGTQELYDRIANALLEYKQESSTVGYKYL